MKKLKEDMKENKRGHNMDEKIALVSCSGLSPLGLVVRAATVELALDNDNIVAACITEYSAQPNNCSPILDDAKIAQPNNCSPILDDAKIVSITGCSDDCVSTILNEKNVEVIKNIDAENVVKAFDLNPNDAIRLDDDGEKAVKVLKRFILKELKSI